MILPGWSTAELEAAAAIAAERRRVARDQGDTLLFERQATWLDRLLDALHERTHR